MGGTPVIMQGFQSLLLNPQRGLRIAKRFSWLMIRARLPMKNYNWRQKKTGIPQPAFFNSVVDNSITRIIKSNFWLQDMNILYSDAAPFHKLYQNFDYDGIGKTFYPTKNNAMESVNMAKIWDVSWWNPNNNKNQSTQIFKKSDVLFADMLVNTQGVYKAKRVIKGSDVYNKVKNYFEDALSPHRKHFGEKCTNGSLIDTLVENDNLYYIEYPELKQIEDDDAIRRQIGGQKYSAVLTTSTTRSKHTGYIEIPFGIFSTLPNYIPESDQSFVCIGSVFNDSKEVYHPFDEGDRVKRDKWQLAKAHFASTDNNDFIIRVHLGHLHYASAVYTTAFCNLARQREDLKWFKDGFIDKFSYGLLQINFLANLTLVDSVDPIAQKTIYLRSAQSLPLIQRENAKFNIMEFNPFDLGKNSYKSTSVYLSEEYYKKLCIYIDYLFEENRKSWEGRTKEIGRFIYNQLKNGADKFDALPESICDDDTQKSLKKIVKNLAYLWLIHHGETFSIISVVNCYYFCPTFMRKPLSQAPNSPMSDLDKQQWLAPKEVINDSTILSKQVTYRNDLETIVSQWGRNSINNVAWNQIRKAQMKQNYKYQDYEEFWNDICIKANKLNYQRSQKGLFYLHWLMPHEMPNALNI